MRTVRQFTPTYRTDTYSSIDPTKLNLNGKTILITGASKGIGAATSVSFARAGASTIIIGARSPLDKLKQDMLAAAKECNRSEPNVLCLELDVSSRESVEAAAKRVAEITSKIDILINNAGYLETFRPIADSDPEEWWKTWEVNIRGIHLVCRSFLSMLLKSELKTILNVTSLGAHLTMHGASAYQSGKLALLRMTEFLMTEYGEQGLIAFCAHPGSVSTELARNMPEKMHAVLNDSPQLAGDFFMKSTSQRKQWLAGRYVSVNWDWDELEAESSNIVAKDLLKVRLALL